MKDPPDLTKQQAQKRADRIEAIRDLLLTKGLLAAGHEALCYNEHQWLWQAFAGWKDKHSAERIVEDARRQAQERERDKALPVEPKTRGKHKLFKS